MPVARYLIQSKTSGAFCVPGEYGQPTWEMDLRKAGVGLLEDIENCWQIIEDHFDFEDQCQIVDLQRLLIDPEY